MFGPSARFTQHLHAVDVDLDLDLVFLRQNSSDPSAEIFDLFLLKSLFFQERTQTSLGSGVQVLAPPTWSTVDRPEDQNRVHSDPTLLQEAARDKIQGPRRQIKDKR